MYKSWDIIRFCMISFSFSYYDGDQDKLFSEAHVISPFKKTLGATAKKVIIKLIKDLIAAI